MNPKDIQKEYINKLKPQNPAVKFRDGRLSIQASSYNYCHPKSDRGPYLTFEVAYLIGDGIFANIPELPFTGDEVYGYVPLEDVVKLLVSDGYNKKQILYFSIR